MNFRKIVAIVAAALMLFSILPISAMAAENRADFDAIVDTNTSYTAVNTPNGWVMANAAVFQGGSSNSSPNFAMIASSSATKAVCLNGKTSAPGSITSPALTGGISKLTFDYGLPFKDTKISLTITITGANGDTATKTVENLSASQLTKYSEEWVLDTEITGDFTVVIKNNSPSNNTGNKDRTAVWNLEWESATAGSVDCDHNSLDCGDTCPECGVYVKEHKYDNDCDANCNNCDAAREVGDHVYNNDYDVVCSICGGGAREVAPEVIVDAAYDLASGSSLPGTFTLTGVISSVDTAYSSTYGNVTVTMNVLDSEGNVIEGQPIQCYRLTGTGADVIGIGYTITVTGTLKNYNGTIEFDAACTLDSYSEPVCTEHEYTSDYDADCNNCGEIRDVVLPTDPAEIVDAAYTLAAGESFQENVTLTGVITEVSTEYNADYENVSVIIDVLDSEGNVIEGQPILCYRMKGDGADVIAEGYIITVTGIIKNHNGTVEFDANCSLDSYEAPECEHEYAYDCSKNCKLCGEETRPEAEHSYFYPCDPVCQICYEITNPDATHTIVHVEAVAPTCTALGNIEYWYCSDCGAAWSDEACTQITSQMSVKLPMADHEYFYPCDPVCMNCGEITNPDAAHSVKHVEAKAATCYENGNVEYWYCEICGAAWTDEAMTQITNVMSVVVPMAHAEATHVEAVAPTCYENGNIEYWYCEACGQAWLDEACTLNTNLMAVVLPMAHGTITHVEAVAPTCTALGNIEYWYCEACGQAWLDEACTLNTNMMAVKLPMADHDYVGEETLEATCDLTGEMTYTCSVCGDSYTEEIPAWHDGNLTHVPAVEATDCAHPGNIEYYTCPWCNEYFTDANASEYINPWFIEITVDCVRPEGVADCANWTCETCGNENYGYGEHDTGVPACQDGHCSKCDQDIAGFGCANYDTPACEDGVCYYCGGFVAGFGHENGAWAPCQDGECSYGCGLTYPATAEHVDDDGDDYCDTCWSHLNHIDDDGDHWCDTCWSEIEGLHIYDNDYDVDCNECGAIREVELPIAFGGNSVSEDVNGLAFKFDVSVLDMAIVAGTKTEADYTNATVDGYKLVKMGAVVSNGVSEKNIEAVYLCDLSEDSASFAVRVINIPADKLDVEITAIPYVVIEIDGVETTIYGDAVVSSYAAVLG